MRLRLAVIAAVVFPRSRSACAARAAPIEIAAQVSLRSKGMYFGKIDGLAGPMTAKGLRAFQRAARLPVTGELGLERALSSARSAVHCVARRVLVQGTYGWDVSSLQFLLARAGHLRLLEVDGHFGASTKAGLSASSAPAGSRGTGSPAPRR